MLTPKKARTLSQPDRRLLVLSAEWLTDHRAPTLTALGTFLTVLSPVFSWPTWALSLGTISLILGILFAAHDSKRISSAEAENGRLRERELRTRRALNSSIDHIARNLSVEVGLYSSDVRMTVYAHDDGQDIFIPLVRVSNNPEHEKLNRQTYPADQGFLAQAWTHGRSQAWDLTDHKAKKAALAANFSEKEYEQLPFKLASCLGLRLTEGTTHVGVVFWESTDRTRIQGSDEALDLIEGNPTLTDLTSVLAASSELVGPLSAHEFILPTR